MRRFLIYPVLFLMMMPSCRQSQVCSIEGRITNPEFFGSKVYLVALDAPVTRNVDSTTAENGKFSFEIKADSFAVKILRVRAKYPRIIEDLVIIPEPGKIYVVLDSISRGHGTRLNNLLQEWKIRKRIHDSIQFSMFVRKNRDGIGASEADSLAQFAEMMDRVFKSDNICMINSNLHNGIGLLIYKVYFDALPADEKNYITRMTGKEYTDRDAQLRKRFY